MKYLCLVYLDEKKLDAVPDRECKACGDSLRENGYLVAAEALQGVHTATTVRVRNGKVSVTDGPFAETKEQLAGFYLIDAERPERGDQIGVEDSAGARRQCRGPPGPGAVRELIGRERRHADMKSPSSSGRNERPHRGSRTSAAIRVDARYRRHAGARLQRVARSRNRGQMAVRDGGATGRARRDRRARRRRVPFR